MNIDIESIHKLFRGNPDYHEQYIVASGDEDMPAVQIIDWIMPLLRGIADHNWAACEFELGGDNVVLSRYQSCNSKIQYEFFDSWSREEADRFRAVIPSSTGLVIVAIGNYSNQVFTLVDSVASWLSIFNPQQLEMRPLRRLLATSEDVARAGG